MSQRPKARSSFGSHVRNYREDAARHRNANQVMRESGRRARYGDPDFVGPTPEPLTREPVRFDPDEADVEIPAPQAVGTMTGTDRASLRLALGVLRGAILRRQGHAIFGALQVLGQVDGTQRLAAQVAELWPCLGFPATVLRARLCLFIRAVLRAEDGGGPSDSVFHVGGWTFYGPNAGERAVAAARANRLAGHDTSVVQARPLWTDAPEHRP